MGFILAREHFDRDRGHILDLKFDQERRQREEVASKAEGRDGV